MKSAEREAARALGLGNSRQEIWTGVARERARVFDLIFDDGEGVDGTGLPAGAQTLDHAVPMLSFPQIRFRAHQTISLVDHQANLAHLLDAYGITYRYNLITKRMESEHPDIPNEGDNAEFDFYSHLLGLSAMNGVPRENLDTHLVALGDAHAYNPVVDYLLRLAWDGVSRIGTLATDMDLDDPEVAKIALRIFLNQAAAAADHAENARALYDAIQAHFEYVLVFVGAHSAGKTKGLRRRLPRPLRT